MEFFNFRATNVWFKDAHIWVKLENGEITSDPIFKYPLLAKATPEQLEKFEIIDGYALYWPELDEDLSIAGFFENPAEKEKDITKETLQIV